MPVISECYSVIIDRGISAPGHVKEVVDGINDIDKSYIYQLMSTIKLTVSNIFDYHMQMNTGNQNNDVSLAKEFQQHLTKKHRKDDENAVIYTKRFMKIK